MKTAFKFLIRTVGGGFGFVFLYLVGNSIKDVYYFFEHGIPCGELAYIPLQIILGLLIVPGWDDWQILFFCFGALVVLMIQVWSIAKFQRAKQLFVIIQLVFLVAFSLGTTLEIQTEVAIKKAYSDFCLAVNNQNYVLAYSYFSPEYQRAVGKNQFVKQIINDAGSSYIEGCQGEFVGSTLHRMNGARLYPFLWSNTACYLFLGGPELIMVRIDGKWYFTGEHTWYVGL
jgi:hypothetical protein